MENSCMRCGKSLTRDEIGAHKKLVNRGAKEFLCIGCLAQTFQVEPALIYERIEHFKKQGCVLFR